MTHPTDPVVQALRECPFCGKQPAVLPLRPKQDGDGWTKIYCENEACVVCEITSYTDDHRADATYLWNRRAHDAARAEPVADPQMGQPNFPAPPPADLSGLRELAVKWNNTPPANRYAVEEREDCADELTAELDRIERKESPKDYTGTVRHWSDNI